MITEDHLLERLLVEAARRGAVERDLDRAVRAGEEAALTIRLLKGELATAKADGERAEALRRQNVGAESERIAMHKALRDLSEAVSEFFGTRRKTPKFRREGLIHLADANHTAKFIVAGERPF